MSIPVAGVLAVLNWQPISVAELGWVILSASLILTYNGLAVVAYKKAPASQIALAEYSGLIFVAILGVWWFDEIPNWLTVIGICLILLPLIPKKWISQQLVTPRSSK